MVIHVTHLTYSASRLKIGDFLQSQTRKIAYALRASDAFPQLPDHDTNVRAILGFCLLRRLRGTSGRRLNLQKHLPLQNQANAKEQLSRAAIYASQDESIISNFPL